MPKHARTKNDDTSLPVTEDLSSTEFFDEENTQKTSTEVVGDEIDEKDSDALEALTPEVGDEPLLLASIEEENEVISADAWGTDKGKDKRKKKKKNLTVYQKKSRRMRRILTVAILLLLALIGAMVYLGYTLMVEASKGVSQQISQETNESKEQKDSDAKDTATTVTKKTEVPQLIVLLGKTQDEAVTILKKGATVTSVTPVNEEGNPVKNKVKITLTDEPGDVRSGTPTVYLGLNEEGLTLSAGYSAATASLGYGALSFTDAIKNESIVENTLAEAGVKVPKETAVLPDDKTLYSEYSSDGKTLVNESYSFEGKIEEGGVAYQWSAVLRYNYAAANASGNLADTIRQIYIYVNK